VPLLPCCQRWFLFLNNSRADQAVRKLDPPADHGERSYQGTNKLVDRVAIITGGNSGIGRAAAIAFAREGANIVLSHLRDFSGDPMRRAP
jgi:hypothetical protein